MDVTDTIDHGVATALPTGVKLLFHRLSKEEKDPATTVIHRYLRETYAHAFEQIHALNHDPTLTKLVDAIWSPLGAVADANEGELRGLENETQLLQFCLQGGGVAGSGHRKILPDYDKAVLT